MHRTRTIYNFKNTCQSCLNDIEIPLLGDFAYGEIILQTQDGQDFYLAQLIENQTLGFIVRTLENDAELSHMEADPQKVLTLLADKVGGKDFAIDYPLCPICLKKLFFFTDNIRTSKRELQFVTWTNFESLPEEEKVNQIIRVVQYVK